MAFGRRTAKVEHEQVKPEQMEVEQADVVRVNLKQVKPEQDDTLTLQPFDVYSERRWSFLQGEGFAFDSVRGRAFRPAGPNEVTGDGEVMGVVVPGDPGYEGLF